MNRKTDLLSQCIALERMMAETPAEDVIDLGSLRCALDAARRELAEAEDSPAITTLVLDLPDEVAERIEAAARARGLTTSQFVAECAAPHLRPVPAE